MKRDIQLISASSVLGLKPTGVEELGKSLLDAGLKEKLRSPYNVIEVPTLNHLYNSKRDPVTQCLNPQAIINFSISLADTVSRTIDQQRFALVLGGDCSILIGILPALKAKGRYGLVFLDAHADFYSPERSLTGEAADMDLAIVTGRGPHILTGINGLGPYVEDERVIHLGQRDQEETEKYGSPDIRKTGITCMSLAEIERQGLADTLIKLRQSLGRMNIEGCWIHFDTDVLSDALNPAVDYRLPGGLVYEQTEAIIAEILSTGLAVGMSVTIFNPRLDPDGRIAKDITRSLARSLQR